MSTQELLQETTLRSELEELQQQLENNPKDESALQKVDEFISTKYKSFLETQHFNSEEILGKEDEDSNLAQSISLYPQTYMLFLMNIRTQLDPNNSSNLNEIQKICPNFFSQLDINEKVLRQSNQFDDSILDITASQIVSSILLDKKPFLDQITNEIEIVNRAISFTSIPQTLGTKVYEWNHEKQQLQLTILGENLLEKICHKYLKLKFPSKYETLISEQIPSISRYVLSLINSQCTTGSIPNIYLNQFFLSGLVNMINLLTSVNKEAEEDHLPYFDRGIQKKVHDNDIILIRESIRGLSEAYELLSNYKEGDNDKEIYHHLGQILKYLDTVSSVEGKEIIVNCFNQIFEETGLKIDFEAFNKAYETNRRITFDTQYLTLDQEKTTLKTENIQESFENENREVSRKLIRENFTLHLGIITPNHERILSSQERTEDHILAQLIARDRICRAESAIQCLEAFANKLNLNKHEYFEALEILRSTPTDIPSLTKKFTTDSENINKFLLMVMIARMSQEEEYINNMQIQEFVRSILDPKPQEDQESETPEKSSHDRKKELLSLIAFAHNIIVTVVNSTNKVFVDSIANFPTPYFDNLETYRKNCGPIKINSRYIYFINTLFDNRLRYPTLFQYIWSDDPQKEHFYIMESYEDEMKGKYNELYNTLLIEGLLESLLKNLKYIGYRTLTQTDTIIPEIKQVVSLNEIEDTAVSTIIGKIDPKNFLSIANILTSISERAKQISSIKSVESEILRILGAIDNNPTDEGSINNLKTAIQKFISETGAITSPSIKVLEKYTGERRYSFSEKPNIFKLITRFFTNQKITKKDTEIIKNAITEIIKQISGEYYVGQASSSITAPMNSISADVNELSLDDIYILIYYLSRSIIKNAPGKIGEILNSIRNYYKALRKIEKSISMLQAQQEFDREYIDECLKQYKALTDRFGFFYSNLLRTQIQDKNKFVGEENIPEYIINLCSRLFPETDKDSKQQ